MLRPLLLATVCLLLAPLAVPIAAWAAGSFDGVYRGNQAVIRDDTNPSCTKSAHSVVLRIVDNSFIREWGTGRYGVKITLHVGADGSFKGEAFPANTSGRYSGPVDIHGRIADGTLQAELGTNTCAVRLTLHKS